jgi:putative DNA primase/helicase
VAELKGLTVDATQAGIEPQAFQIFARRAESQFGEDAFAFVAGTRTRDQAEALVERLYLVAALSTDEQYRREANLARVLEARVHRDPNATDEELSAVKEARTSAEIAEIMALLDGGEAQRQGVGSERQPPAQDAKKAERHYINVPFREKQEAKGLGARWDRNQQSWYIPAGIGPTPFARWTQGQQAAPEGVREASESQPTQEAQKHAQKRVYLAVPYSERAAAKAAGAAWDKLARSWYAGPRADLAKLERWRSESALGRQDPAMTPREEFAEAMRSLGCLVTGDHPIMDGKTHRIGVEGDKPGEHAGFYVGHLDGHPAGYVKNNRTGQDMRWKSKGYVLDDAEKTRLQSEAATKLAERAAEQERAYEASAQRVSQQLSTLVPLTEPTPYLRAKGIGAHAGAYTDREGQKTYIPAIDVHGKQWTMQYIQEDGTKRFAKDSRKDGCFHAVGGMQALTAAAVLVVAEGYATAASLAEALGQATVAAFDSGNLPAVARALHEKYPDKPVIIAGDDDRPLELTQGVNPGRTKAEEAAKAVGGTAIFPIFAPGENSYPSHLPLITPQGYRAHAQASERLAAAEKVPTVAGEAEVLQRALLQPEQLAALANLKAYTDFNDLAGRSALGREGIKRQVGAAVHQALKVACQEHIEALDKDRRIERRQGRTLAAG